MGQLSAGPDAGQTAYQQLFKRYVGRAADYWRAQLAAHTHDPAALDAEAENIASAAWLALQSADALPSAFALLAQARTFLMRRAQLVPWGEVLQEAVACAQRARTELPPGNVVDVLGLAARIAQRRARLAEAEACYQLALERARLPGVPGGAVARVTVGYGHFLIIGERSQQALAYLTRALELATREDLPSIQLEALLALGVAHNWLNDGASAQNALERALPLAEEQERLGDSSYLGRVLTELGNAYWHLEDLERAENCLVRAEPYVRQSGDRMLATKLLNQLGILCCDRRRCAEAAGYLHRCEAGLQELGEVIELPSVWNNLGVAYYGLADWEASARYFERAYDTWRTQGHALRAAEVLGNLADCCIEAGWHERARQLLGQTRADVTSHAGEPGWSKLAAYLDELEQNLARAGSALS